MLIVFFGVSCAGKTSIIRQLNTIIKTSPINAYTTRPLRLYDVGRICVSLDQYEDLVQNGEIIWPVELYGHKYGISKSDINISLYDIHNIYTLDHRLVKNHELENISSVNFLVYPSTIEDLKRFIYTAKRTERSQQIITEYSTICIDYYIKNRYIILHNEYGSLDLCVNHVYKELVERGFLGGNHQC